MSTDTTPTPRELRARADAITEQAKDLRKDLLEWHETRLTEVGIARDRAAREQYAAEQSAKSADIQVKREKADVAEMNKGAAELEASALAAEKKGDLRVAEENRELAADYRNSADIHAARARQAELDAAELREQAAQQARRVVELETQKSDLVKEGSEASAQLDKMEDQARLLDEAAHKMTMAEMLTGAEPPGSMADVDKRVIEISTLEVEAEEALEKANDMEIDRTKITNVLPDATFETDATPVSTTADPTETEGSPIGATTGTGDTTDGGDATAEGSELLDTDWLQEFLDEPAPTPDLSDDYADVTVTDSGFDMEPADVTFADAVAPGADDPLDDTGMDDFA